MSGNILQIQNVLNELPDDSWFYAVYAGKDYKIKGSTIKNIVPNISGLQTITDNTLNTSSKTVPGAINEVNTIAKGMTKSRSFATLTALNDWLAIPANVALLNIGDNLYIVAIDTPDYWWDGTQKQILETSKFDLSTIILPIKTGMHVYNPSISVPFASSITLDLSTGALFDIAQLTGPITLDTTNAKAGMTFLIRILQGTTAYTCTFGSTFVHNFGETAITTTVSKYTQIACSCFVDGIIDYTISYQN